MRVRKIIEQANAEQARVITELRARVRELEQVHLEALECWRDGMSYDDYARREMARAEVEYFADRDPL